MGKLTTYPSTQKFQNGDILIVDGASGTRKITAEDAAAALAGLLSSVNRRNVFRGKNLGSTVTEEQKAAIQNGTFEDLFIGDYWQIENINYRIADMDYWYKTGDTSLTKHHVVLLPDQSLYQSAMNDKDDTTGGYTGSKMYTEGLGQAKNTITEAFGELLLSKREYLINAVSDGHASAGAWVDSQIELMNEVMAYGHSVYGVRFDSQPVAANFMIDNRQLALFQLTSKWLYTGGNYWLRDIASQFAFAAVAGWGFSYCNSASISQGVRPVFAVGA